MMKTPFTLSIASAVVLSAAAVYGQAAEGTRGVEQTTVYRSGEDGYHTYRIPAMAVTTKGTILAFCEGRKNRRNDWGDVDIVLKRSTDDGKTWSEQILVTEEGTKRIGCPTPIVDRNTGAVHLAFTRGVGPIFVMTSQDDGVTWSERREIRKRGASSPGHGIQLARGRHKGRLCIPATWQDEKGCRFIYSDDAGKTWTFGDPAPELVHGEFMAAERADGSIVLTVRRGEPHRYFAYSNDGGESWHDTELREDFVCPGCQGSIIDTNDGKILLHCNPASQPEPNHAGRKNLTIRMSLDGGKTWPFARVLHKGPAAYSDLVELGDGSIGCLYESGDMEDVKPDLKNNVTWPWSEEITFARFPLEWVEGD